MVTTFTVLHIIVCVLLVLIVLVQEGKDPGMKGISGSAPDAGESFFSQNGGSTKKSMMSKLTIALSVLFLITTIAMVILASR